MTGNQVKAFASQYCKAMGIRIIEKGTVMWIVTKLLRRLSCKYIKILDALSDHLRPMALVKFIFLTFRVGGGELHFVEQIRIIVHEVVHCLRIRRWKEKGGKAEGWYKEYYTNSLFRAIEEAIACAAAGEIVRFLTKRKLNPPDLSSYYVKETDVKAAHEVYKKHFESGGITFNAVREAIVILKRVGIYQE